MANTQTPPAVDITVNHKPTGKMYLSTLQEGIVNLTWTEIDFDTIPGDFADDIEDTANNKITPGVAGFYDIIGQVVFADLVANHHCWVRVRKNGTTTVAENGKHNALTSDFSVEASDKVYLSATDYLTVEGRHDSGVDTITIVGGINSTFLSVQRER